jgi:micrococcal nuclease
MISKLIALAPSVVTAIVLMLYSGCLSKETKQPQSMPPQRLSTSPDEAPSTKTPSVLIKHCHDGDTCQVKTDGGLWFSVRLAGIDAPEIGHSKRKTTTDGQPLAVDARDTLIKILASRDTITMNQIDLDPFNRPVVEIFAGDTCVNLKMLELGMAERYRGRSKLINSQIYDAAEQLAKANRVGVWGLKVYESPSRWRKNRKT